MMKDRQLLFALLISGMSLGTAWAVRGQFGHEQGAAWAGGIGAVSIVLLSKRADWFTKVFHLALASAVGWGIGGMISYGLVVGYGRGTDFGNVYYGLVMLFLIGGLFGLIGGGLFGLVLSDEPERPVRWHQLIVEMTAGALIFYYFLIEELEWLMTPPRSEAWAACFGMAVAMIWFMIRNRYFAALRVAVFAGLGGGFGFAFGNFLQVMGNISGIKFNFWNVMEYSIGFFGGIGMAYGTFTSDWPYEQLLTPRRKTIAPIIILMFIIPFLVWEQSFDMERLLSIANIVQPLEDNTGVTLRVQWLSFLLAITFGVFGLIRFYRNKTFDTIAYYYDEVSLFFLGYLGLFIIYSILITMAFVSFYRVEQYLYIINFVLITVLIGRFEPETTERGLNPKRWLVNLIFVLAFLAILTAVAVNSHGPLPNVQNRF
jgi:hypothetical protein